MKRNIGIILLFSAGLVFLTSKICFADSTAGNIKKGNQMYRQGKFDEALKCYNKARAGEPDSAIIDFNAGAALYQKKDYPKAADAFTKALAVENKDLEAKASYNMGNSRYRMGKSKADTDLSGAVSLYKQALGYYKRAIELDPKNTDAKYNYEFVEKELKVLLDKLKHQKQKKQQQSKNQKQNNQKQNKQQSQQSKREEKKQQQSQNKSGQQQKEGSQKQEQPQQPMQDHQEKMSEQKNQQVQPLQGEQKEMSEQEARMILKRSEQQEISASNEAKNKKEGYYPPVLKDW